MDNLLKTVSPNKARKRSNIITKQKKEDKARKL